MQHTLVRKPAYSFARRNLSTRAHNQSCPADSLTPTHRSVVVWCGPKLISPDTIFFLLSDVETLPRRVSASNQRYYNVVSCVTVTTYRGVNVDSGLDPTATFQPSKKGCSQTNLKIRRDVQGYRRESFGEHQHRVRSV